MATIRKNGKKWQAIIRNVGFKHQSKSFALQKDAIAWAKVVESEQVRGTFVDTLTASSTSFLDCLNRYEKEQEKAGRRSLTQLKSQLNIIRQSDLVSLSLANVTPAEIVKYKELRMSTGLKASTYIKDHNLLHTLFEVIQKDWAITLPRGNPVKLVSKPKHTSPTSRNRRIMSGEEDSLLSILNKSSPQTAIIVRFALETGMRRGEIMNMRYRDVSTRTLTIPVTKTDYPRVVPLTKKAHKALSERTNYLTQNVEKIDTSDSIVSRDKNGRPDQIDVDRLKVFDIKPDSVSRAFKRACKKAGIVNLTFHDLRHEAITRLFEQGLSLMEVAHISGHKSFEVLKKYTHLDSAELLKKMQKNRDS